MGDVVVGTCSWTDKTMIERWYPPGTSSAEARLRYYAERYDSVEVDSTFYGIPKREYAEAWARRTPAQFTFHVKAYGMMTGHEVDHRALHPDLRDAGYRYALSPYGRVRDPEERMVEHAFELFGEAVAPLVEAGKMGGVLLQFPARFTAADRQSREHNLGVVERALELIAPLHGLVEFRHASWAADTTLRRVVDFLSRRDATLVAVDAPQAADAGSMPPVAMATSAFGYVRLHGRNREMWSARTASAADRFDYLYRPEELEEWHEPVRELAHETERTWIMFNNCKYDYAPRNAKEMAAILGDLVAPRRGGVPTGEPAPTFSGPEHVPGADEPTTTQMDLGF